MNALKTLNDLPSTKAQIESFVQVVTEEIREGHTDPLLFAIFAKGVIKALTAVITNTEELCLIEADKYRGEVVNGSLIEVVEAGVKYDFTNCCDENWNELNYKIDTYKTLQKDREAFLKAIKLQLEIVTSDGEVSTLYPPVKSSKTVTKLTAK